MMGEGRKPLGLLALIAVSAILVSAVIAVNADARGANANGKKGGGGTPAPTGACSVTPSTVAQWDIVTITGSGFWANSWMGFSVNGSMGWVQTDGSGSFTATAQAYQMGTNTVNISGGGGPATCTFQVV